MRGLIWVSSIDSNWFTVYTVPTLALMNRQRRRIVLMLSMRLFFAISICPFVASQLHAGISMQYSGQPQNSSGQSFNFAVSSTNPTMLGSNPDSPSEPVLDYFFPRLLELRDFGGFGPYSRFQAPTMMGGGGNGARGGGFGGSGDGRLAMGNKSGGYGGGGGGVGLPNGGNTTSGDQSVSGTGGIVCGPDQGVGGGGDQGDGGSGDTDPVDGGGSPNPSAVPEPSSFALWSLVTCMLVFGTRRIARR